MLTCTTASSRRKDAKIKLFKNLKHLQVILIIGEKSCTKIVIDFCAYFFEETDGIFFKNGLFIYVRWKKIMIFADIISLRGRR